MSNIKDKKVPNVPNLRFVNFDADWIVTTYEKVADIVSGGTPDTENVVFWNGNIEWFTPSEIGKEKYVRESIRKITIDGLTKSSAKILPINTILLSTRATIGECSIAKNECTTNQGFQSLIAKKNIYFEFLYYLTLTKKRLLCKNSSGSTFLEISNREIKKLFCHIPTIKEQEKIANFLTLIDERIATQNKIIDKLESLIKGISNKLISSCDMNFVPLGKISKIKKGEQINGLELTNSGYYYLNGGITHSGYTDNYNTNEDTISISEGGNSCGFVNYNKEKFWCGGHCYTIIPNRTLIDNLYLYYFLKNKENDIMRLRVGSGLPNIQKSTLEKFAIKLPCIDEQKRIAQILGNLNEKLGVYILLTEKLKEQKKFLLQNLFI